MSVAIQEFGTYTIDCFVASLLAMTNTKNMKLEQSKSKQKGSLIIFVIIIIFIFTMIMIPVVANLISRMQLLKLSIAREQAFQIAEAGRNYYEWHFIKFPGDYNDDGATDLAGATEQAYDIPARDYTDTETQQVIGYFSLHIIQPPQGADNIIVQSTGWTNEYPNVKRTVEAKYYRDSVAQYAVLTNSPGYIFTNIGGKFYSTSGVRDVMPTASASIISQKCASSDCSTYSTYVCPVEDNMPCDGAAAMPAIFNTYCNTSNQCTINGTPASTKKICSADSDCASITTCDSTTSTCIIGGNTGTACSTDDDCAGVSTTSAKSWWTEPLDADITWTSTISDGVLGTIKAKTDSTIGYYGYYIGITTPANTRYINLNAVAGGNNGCSIVFNPEGTFDVYKVNTLSPAYTDAVYLDGTGTNGQTTSHSTDSTDYVTRTKVICNTVAGATCSGESFVIPENDFVIYVENGYRNVWVEGTVKGRVTVAAATLPYNGGYTVFPSIFIPNNLVYNTSACNGLCALGLISQNYILISHDAPANLEVDGSLITQYKSIGRLTYTGGTCNSGLCINVTGVTCSSDADCRDTDKGTLTTFGSFISNGKSYFGNSQPAGYQNWNFNYDSGFLSAPPPYCPVLNSTYKLNYWRIVN